jgi:hypothetical protein
VRVDQRRLERGGDAEEHGDSGIHPERVHRAQART